jgi:acetyl-CoA/propionyl-CoA carboxylase biotin carboxyl carrier protein
MLQTPHRWAWPLTALPAIAVQKVLVANRGEIAVRIIRALADAGLTSIAIYADGDRDALHTAMADAAYPLDGATAKETYLSIDKIIGVALKAGADAVHPGYGFLSESPAFADAVTNAGLVWIGPPARGIRALGDKVSARRIAQSVGAPLAPGTLSPVQKAEEIEAFAHQYGLPVAIKAAHGGGGRGMRIARTMEEIAELFASATREAVAAFGVGEYFVERYLEQPRHLEAQVLADAHGNVVVLGLRDCSLQRRHQKLVEEAPAPYLPDEVRTAIYESSRAIFRTVRYTGAATAEFLMAGDGTLSFLEVNTRLQVEHGVTEETTGIDIVREMLRIAAGDPISMTDDPQPRGHAIEFRINAEDVGRGFVPAPGHITRLRWPAGPGVRVDAGIEVGSAVSPAFDSLVGKVIVWGADRRAALGRSRRALKELEIVGIATTIPFHRAIVNEPAFTAEPRFRVHTEWIETEFVFTEARREDNQPNGSTTGNAEIEVGGRPMAVHLPGLATLSVASTVARSTPSRRDSAGGSGRDAVTAPMQGTITRLAVANGQEVSAREVIVVLEAMKMEHVITAHKDGIVANLSVALGDSVAQDAVICELRSPTGGGNGAAA